MPLNRFISKIAAALSAITSVASPGASQDEFQDAARPIGPTRITAERLGDGPVIYPGMPGLEGDEGQNINGPAVIRVPDFIEAPLGRYYMYFAHHAGTYIRLAFADRPEGPWTVYKAGTLRLEQTSAIHHIASPDILVDKANKRLLMYFHGPVEDPERDYGGRPFVQRTFVAASTDGLNFTELSGGVSPPYLRAFRYRDEVYALAMADKQSAYPEWFRSGQFLRSADGLAAFESGPRILDEMRHAALLRRGGSLHVFFSRVGDNPESIFVATVNLRPNWLEWTAASPALVLEPERDFEGAGLPSRGSRGGMAAAAERALRDPAVLDNSGEAFLYYTVAGEKGIGVARLNIASGRSLEEPITYGSVFELH